MLSFADALDVVLKSARLTGSERVGFRHSMNRILAEDVYSDIDMPAFDRSMVDGYACRREDLGNGLKVIETIKAGVIPSRRIMRGQCAKIMTGAMVPPGADCVVMVELARGGDVVEFAGSEPKENICRKGRDLKAGQVVLRKGSLIRAQHIAVLASVGQVEVAVARRPSVGIIATGDELVEPEVKPVMSQVRNSNSAQLAAQVEEAGGIVQDYGVAGDEPVGIDRRLKKAMNDNEVILVSGGVSVGDFDYVPGILRKNNVEMLFEKVSIKPGKPTVFGIWKGGCCFGLPGNPVATFVVFELLVKPFLYKRMGRKYLPVVVQMKTGESIGGADKERQSWVPVIIVEDGTVRAIEYHGSADIVALCRADGLVCIDAGARQIEAGAVIDVRLV